MTALYAHEFTWAGHGENVIATGSFDEWKSTLPLTKNLEGKLTATLPIAYGEKITFKYVVDGQWQHNPEEPHESDEHGNINNVFTAPAASVKTEGDVTIVPIAKAEDPILPVPESVGTTTQAAIPAASATETPVAEKVETAVEKTKEEATSLVDSAVAAGTAAVVGAVGVAGATYAAVTGANPPTLVSKDSEPAKEVPLEPTHTPAVPVVAAPSKSVVPDIPAVDKALTEEKTKATGATGGIAAQVTGSKTFQDAEAKAHELAVEADKLKDQAVAEANKRYAEGEKLAHDAYDKVAATSFGASALHALGLDKEKEVAPSTTAAAAASTNEPTPLPAATSNTIIPAATAPLPTTSTSVETPSTTTPIIPTSTAAATIVPAPVAELPSTPVKKPTANGLGNGDAPSTGSPAGSHKARKPSFFKKLFSSSPKKSPAK